MERLRENLEEIRSLRARVKAKDPTLFRHEISEKNPVSSETTISVVMTAHSRSAQVYFTLDMMQRSPASADLQVILVDDSQVDAVSMDRLRTYPFTVELITIPAEAKTWANPCINYNIGLEHVRGGKLILQNGECCHVGDVLSFVASSAIVDGMYYAFDVKAALNDYMNSLLYTHGRANGLQIDVYQEEIYYVWYQHHIHRNAHYHFMTAMTMKTYRETIPDGFSYDYAFGMDYDDDDLLLQIKTRAIPLLCVKHETTGVGGIHLWHSKGNEIGDVRAYTAPSNHALYQHKMSYTCYKGTYPELSRAPNMESAIAEYDALVAHALVTHTSVMHRT